MAGPVSSLSGSITRFSFVLNGGVSICSGARGEMQQWSLSLDDIFVYSIMVIVCVSFCIPKNTESTKKRERESFLCVVLQGHGGHDPLFYDYVESL